MSADRKGPWLNSKQAAAYLGFDSERALCQQVRRGAIRAYKLGRRFRFSQPELDALLKPSDLCQTSTDTEQPKAGAGG